MLLSLFVGGCLVFASEKNDGTNGVGQAEGDTNVLTGVQGRARIPAAPQGVANGESNGPALRRVRGTRSTVIDDDIAPIGILVPEYCWRNYSSWMHTMNVTRTPSEWVVQHVLRKTFAELLADALGAPNWVKFIRERMDLKRYRRAS